MNIELKNKTKKCWGQYTFNYLVNEEEKPGRKSAKC